MRAGRSSWLCHGTMPPGCTTSLRSRSRRSASATFSLPSSIMPSTLSVTSFGFISPDVRTPTLVLSGGHWPAFAGEARRARPAARAAPVRPRRSCCIVTGSIMVLVSCPAPSGERGTGSRITKWRGALKCRLGSGFIAPRYRHAGRPGNQAMEMHQVRYFLAVAEELNFTRAAERCNVAQPSLTRAIKLLEGELGGPLFNRERVNTHLSELGRMVKPYLEQVYEQTREAKRQALDFVKLKKTILKLGVMCTIAPDQLVDLVCAVQSRNPGIELEIMDSSAEKLEERLIEGDLEVAIHCPAANQKDERLHYMALYREQFLVVLPAEHPLGAKNGIRPGDLNGLRYLNRINCEFNGYAGALWKEHGLTCETAYRSERDDWILAMVASGLGFGFMPGSSVSHPRVIGRPMIDPEFWREVSLVTVRGRPHSPGVGALVREAMRSRWLGRAALAVETEQAGAEEAELPARQ